MRPSKLDAWNLLSPELQQYLIGKGWKQLTEIQEKAIPEILNGNNTILIAPTAGGKTEAAVLPMLQKVRKQRDALKDFGILGLFLAPTKALLNDLEPRVHSIVKAIGLNCFKWHGDVSRAKKLGQKKDPPDILLTTPESLEGIFVSEHIPHKEWFAQLCICIVDEAHNFLGGWRGVQLISLLERINEFSTEDLQRVALSATVGNPEELMKWISGSSERSISVVSVHRRWQGEMIEKEITAQLFSKIDNRDMLDYLAKKSAGKKNITFCNSRRACEELGQHYQRRKLNTHVHHSSVSKGFRECAEAEMKYTDKPVSIVATSTLELGIDIGKLDSISQWGTCRSTASFLQRLGRTGRQPGRPQVFSAACDNSNEFLILLAMMNLAERGQVERVIPGRKLYHLLVQQWAAICLADYGLDENDALRLVRIHPLFNDISVDEALALLKNMEIEDYFHSERNKYYIGKKLERTFGKKHYMDLIVVFDSPVLYSVLYGRQEVGSVSASFINGLAADTAFTLAGRTWIEKKIDPLRLRVLVEPLKVRSRAPIWDSFGFGGISFIVAQEVANILSSDNSMPWIKDQNSTEALGKIRCEYQSCPPMPMQAELFFKPPHRYILRTFFGDAANSAISHLLAALGYVRNRISYQGIIFDACNKEPATVINEINEQFSEVMNADDPVAYGLELNVDVKHYKFSKFADMLPLEMISKSLVANRSNFVELAEILKRISFQEISAIESKAENILIASNVK